MTGGPGPVGLDLAIGGAVRVSLLAVALFSFALEQTQKWGECGLNLAFPKLASSEAAPVAINDPVCQRCGNPYPSLNSDGAAFVCHQCVGREWYFRFARAGFRTEGQVHESITGFKYRDESHRLNQLVEWLTGVYDQHAGTSNWNGLVPVPLYHRRRRMRGFNQAWELASGLEKRRKIPVWDCLYRYRETPSQTGLERKARWENMDGAFRLKPQFDVRGQNMLLVDDVFTTGATTNACAQVLAGAGAGELAVLTISRS